DARDRVALPEHRGVETPLAERVERPRRGRPRLAGARLCLGPRDVEPRGEERAARPRPGVVLEREQPGTEPLGGDARPRGAPDVLRRADDVALDLPAQRGVAVQEPRDQLGRQVVLHRVVRHTGSVAPHVRRRPCGATFGRDPRRRHMNVAETIVEIMEDAGVERVYGLPGDSLNGFTDAVRRSEQIGWQHVRHEEAAAFAAGAEAALTGRLTVCAGSCGPGNLHLIHGLFDAQRSRVPVLAIAAHIPAAEVGSGYFQETHPQELFRECSVYCELVSTPQQLPRVLEIAMRTAVERRGVAVVVVPGETFLTEGAERRRSAPITATRSVVRPHDDELRRAADILNGAKKVTILGGAGTQGAHDRVVELAGRLKAPIVHALRGKEFLEYDNPYDVGMTGLLGFSSGYRAMEACDALLMLGTDFPYQQFFPSKATIVQVDLRGEHIGRRTPVDLGLEGDVGDTIDALLPLLDEHRDHRHLDASLKRYARARKDLDDLADNDRNRTPIHPQYVA